MRLHESNSDSIADSYLFACEQLYQKRCKRLRQYRPGGKARFETWLRAVVWNLCIDFRRKKHGRSRVFESIQSLPSLEQEVFDYIYLRGSSTEETFRALVVKYGNLTTAQVNAVQERLDALLTPRQRWLLSTKSAVVRTEPSNEEERDLHDQIPDSKPDPETQAASREQQRVMQGIMKNRPSQDRLLIRLRFEQGLTLDKIAELTGLSTAQMADRRIRTTLERIRKQLRA